MACGCPVISPHNSAMIEVVEAGGLTIKSWEMTEWRSGLNDVILNRQHFVNQGYQKIKFYDWEKIIQRFYNETLNSTVN